MNDNADAAASLTLGRLITGRDRHALQQVLWDLVEEAKSGDMMAPVTVVSPSQYANLYLRQDLGRNGFINVRFYIMPVLSEFLGGASLASDNRRPLTGALRSAFLRKALSQTRGILAAVGQHPKTQESVQASFQELRRMDEGELADLEERDGLTREVVALYRQYRESVASQWYDPEDLTARAADEVEQGRAPALTDLGHIVFYMPRAVSSGEARLMLELARQGRCSVMLALSGDEAADYPLTNLASALEPALGPAKWVGEVKKDSPPPPLASHLHVASSVHEEMRWVIRQIVAEAGETGTPFHRMAVLYRMENPYGAAIRDELALAGIPMAGPGRDTLGDTPAGRTLTGMLELSGNDFRRDEVMEWLTSCPVRPDRASAGHSSPGHSNPGQFSPSQWDAVSRRAGVTGGLEQWKARLEAYAISAVEEAEERRKRETISEAQAETLAGSARSARDLATFVGKLAEDVTPPDDGSAWPEFCDWATNLLETYLARPSGGNDGDQERFDRERFDRETKQVLQKLEEIKAAGLISQGTTVDEFRQALREAMRVPQGNLGATGRGVFVANFGAALGMNFDAVWLVGMIEGAVPPAIRPDPLLPAAMDSIDGHPSRFQRRMGSERYDYLSALATAPRRTLSYPVAESANHRVAHPSRWFLEQASGLAGRQVHSGDLPSLAGETWLSVTQSAEHALEGIPEGRVADTLDYQLNRLVDWRHEGRLVSRHPLAAGGTLARSMRMGRERRSRRFTAYDGNLTQSAGNSSFGRNLGRQPISPTRLEAWSACPFQYFLGNVLRLGALETPEDTIRMAGLERGTLVHRVLERFMAGYNGSRPLPPPGEPWPEEDRERLMAIAEEEFRAAEARGVTGKGLLWELEMRNIRDDLDAFLVAEADLRQRFQTATVRVETSFGLGNGSPEVSDGATGLRFRGMIDRVDISADGKSALVMDYKTGSPRPFDNLKNDPIDRGKRLQLGIYSLAARQLAPDATRVRAAYWLASSRGAFGFAPADFFDIEDPDTGRRFREAVSAAVTGIGQGVFPANPGEPRNGDFANCRYCDFKTLCPSQRGQFWELKKTDEAVDIYLQLAEGEPQVGETEEV